MTFQKCDKKEAQYHILYYSVHLPNILILVQYDTQMPIHAMFTITDQSSGSANGIHCNLK